MIDTHKFNKDKTIIMYEFPYQALISCNFMSGKS